MDLYEAYGLAEGDAVAVVGAGGRGSLIRALAADAIHSGLSVIVTATTRSRPTPDFQGLQVRGDGTDLVDRVASGLTPGAAVLATGEMGANDRIAALGNADIEALLALGAGLTLIDADGAGGRLFKAPADHEPVIPAGCNHVIVCASLAVLGRPLGRENVHRPEVVMELAPCVPGAIITADTIVEVFTHAEGGRKGVPALARISALLADPPTGEHQRLGSYVAERLVYAGFHAAIVASFSGAPTVLAAVR